MVETEGFLTMMASDTCKVPAGLVFLFIFIDVGLQCLEREVRGKKGGVGKKGFVRVICCMILKIFDHSRCNFGSGIISRITGDGGEGLIVFKMDFWAEESACIFKSVGVVETFG